ncbi:MAG TPA: protein translocase subunit SecF [Candidatus Acidoferrum sp.]|nr:protein translocase subunit SecF [Candidatus Acidoferrum sp.]
MSELPDVTAQQQVADMVDDSKAQVAAAIAPVSPRVRKFNLIGRRNIFFAVSLVVIIPGIVSMWHNHFLLGIDFQGGTEITASFQSNPSIAQVTTAVNAEGLDGSVIQTTGGAYILRFPPLNAAQTNKVQSDMQKSLGAMTVSQILSVGGTIAGETIELSVLAVIIASVAILLLLAIRFRNVPGGWRAGFQFGGSALAALLHDVFVLTGLFSIFGTVLHWQVGEINAYFVTAVLTVVGFSVHDTIVVFDRIRENLRVSQRLSFEQVVNLSVMQTAARSIITSFTVVLVLAAIFISGQPSLQGLALALLIGIVSGTYSSIFNAAPLLVVWRRLQPLR